MLVVLLIVITVIAAAFYNLFAEIFGGVEITITEDESRSIHRPTVHSLRPRDGAANLSLPGL